LPLVEKIGDSTYRVGWKTGDQVLDRKHRLLKKGGKKRQRGKKSQYNTVAKREPKEEPKKQKKRKIQVQKLQLNSGPSWEVQLGRNTAIWGWVKK